MQDLSSPIHYHRDINVKGWSQQYCCRYTSCKWDKDLSLVFLTVSASPSCVPPALQVPIPLVSHSVFQPLLFLWDPPGCLLLSAFDKEIIWNGSRQAQVVGPPATISSVLLDSVIVLGFNLHISFLFFPSAPFSFFFFPELKVSFQFIHSVV